MHSGCLAAVKSDFLWLWWAFDWKSTLHMWWLSLACLLRWWITLKVTPQSLVHAPCVHISGMGIMRLLYRLNKLSLMRKSCVGTKNSLACFNLGRSHWGFPILWQWWDFPLDSSTLFVFACPFLSKGLSIKNKLYHWMTSCITSGDSAHILRFGDSEMLELMEIAWWSNLPTGFNRYAVSSNMIPCSFDASQLILVTILQILNLSKVVGPIL